MLLVLKNSWALLLGVMLLMLGNGMQGTLLGVRGALEGFDAGTMAWVMSGYFAGFLFGSRMTPWMIRQVGHVRVFAALGSLISAVFILYAAVPDPWMWFAMRVIAGFCFSGVYVVSESWLNDASTNETRGQAMSAYLIVQMVGIIASQYLMNFADASGYELFVIMSVLVSLSFLPILLSAAPAPHYQATAPMSLARLFKVSPLGCIGAFLLGGVFAAIFAMAPVYGTQKGMSVADISLFVAVIYTGGLLLQYPLGWASDRMDRRILIVGMTGICALVMFFGYFLANSFGVLLFLGFVVGGTANPLYSLLIAYTNDYLEPQDMASASGGLIFIDGLGALGGPFIVGWMMTHWGADSFLLYVAVLMALISAYGGYRMTRRRRRSVGGGSLVPVGPQATPTAVEAGLGQR